MNVTVIPVIIVSLERSPKSFGGKLKELEIGGRAETIQTTALLRSAGIPIRVLET